MELATAAIAKVLGVGATAAAATSAAAASSSAMSGFATAAKMLQVIAGVGSVVGGLVTSSQQAQQADLQADQEQVTAAQRQTQMKRELLKVLGENDVTFANAGIDISGGIAANAAAAAKKRAAEEITIDRRDQEFRTALHKMRAQGIRTAGALNAGGQLLSIAAQAGG